MLEAPLMLQKLKGIKNCVVESGHAENAESNHQIKKKRLF